MWEEEKMLKYLKENLKEGRFRHSISVKDTAIKLAEIYGADLEKAKIAALIHDCAKYVDIQNMLNILEKYGDNNNKCFEIPAILHAPVGAYIAKDIMEVEDKDILNAITYHTTGRKNMSLLEKIIYLADYIEPFRSFPGVEDVRKLAYNGELNKAMLLSFDNTIKYIVERGQLLHKDTIEARNYILCGE